MNIQELTKICDQYPDIKVNGNSDMLRLYIKNNTGHGTMKFISICDGLLLSYIDIHASIWEDNTPEPEKAVLRFNYCVSGRCEIELENDEITFLSGGELSLSRVSAKQEYKYPGGRYKGIEIFIYKKIFAGEPLKLYGKNIVNMKELFSAYCQYSDTYVACANEHIQFVLQQLWQLQDQDNADLIRLKVLETFLQMKDTLFESYTPPRTYYTRIQADIAKKAEAIIMSDLSVHYTARQFADSFGISESSFKNYFKGVFGKNYSSYQKCKRMELAAELLENTESKLSEIAGKIGYENHSKFSSAFKAYYKISPSDYRRKKRLEKIK